MKLEHFWQKLGERMDSFNHAVFLSGTCQVTAAYQPRTLSDSEMWNKAPCQPTKVMLHE